MCTALERVGARARLFGADQSPYAEAVGICHLIVLHVRPENLICRWLSKDATGLPAIPTLFFGTPENLLSVAPQAHERANGLLVDGCLPEEALMRLRLAITEPRPASMSTAAAPADNVVIAYGDTASHALIETKLKQYGLQFRLASSGPDAILLLRNVQAPVAVVDVNLDGLEALAAIRSEAMPVRTLFIAFQTQEEEILRGFSLGAEDYLVQPFSPLELIARVKKLLG
jgi:CheY-like chemotaxis protein